MSWSNLKFFTAHSHLVPLPDGHRFPMEKYRLLYERLIRDRIIREDQIHPAPPVEISDLLLAHDERFVLGFRDGTLPTEETRPIGLPWSKELYLRSLHSVGGFVAATENALSDGFSAVLAGGTHHAHRDRGEGYCVFNDFAVGALRLLSEKRVNKVLIIDLDVHQGNGNSSILGQRDDVFILSLHGERNYPFRKVKSHLDVALPQGASDEMYLGALSEALGKLPSADVIFYQAGVDVLGLDRLGTFAMSFEGVRARDRMVFEFAKKTGTPLALAIGGGYSDPIEHTIRAYAGTFETAKTIF